MYQPGSRRDIGTLVSPIRAEVAIPAATRWTDRRAVAVRFARFNMVAPLGVVNDDGNVLDVDQRWWSEVKEVKMLLDRLLYKAVSVTNLRTSGSIRPIVQSQFNY
jgi:hypothetical protein